MNGINNLEGTIARVMVYHVVLFGIPLVYHWYTNWYTNGIPFGIPFSIPMVYHFIYTTNGIPSPKIGVRLYQVVPFGIPSSTNLVYQMVQYTILVQ